MIRSVDNPWTTRWSLRGCVEMENHVEMDYFDESKCVTALERQVAITELLRVITAALKSADVDYWLDSGSLLGQIRAQSVIPWDNDADIGVTTAGYEYLRDHELPVPEGFVLNIYDSRLHPEGTRDWIIPGRLVDTRFGFYVDIFVFHETRVNGIAMLAVTPSACWNTCHKCVRVGKYDGFFVIPKSYVYPLISCPFADFTVLCPAKRTSYLDHIYGPDYLIEKRY
ncbi:TPA: hypothetical protein N0F65_004762 [Lagenidium giganteum]|uniref:LicD/FKTN/FKRP nucleotidyltransferase domain-containing protein n=1 Tax=Lagenidium giganteum TaxID=4803 RepID=A0AAV2YV28_9STRA|nr:TPA: hypothetical protein N0F65_004762 [Lagenidium giganteum]